MHKPVMNKDSPFLYNTFTNAAPSYSNESVFFNLILNTNYENTKENCLIFFKNYCKNIIISKRNLFKNIINELTLNQISNKAINNNNDESLYLIRTCINKYSRNNIINALFDFISQNDNNIVKINSSDNINNPLLIENKIVNVVNKEEINVLDKKEKNGEKKRLNKDVIVVDNNIIITTKKKKEKNRNLLKRKRKHYLDNEYIPKEKKIKKSLKENKKNNEVNNDNDNGININTNNDINIKKEKIIDGNDININNNEDIKIKKEKNDIFLKSFMLDEKDEYKNKLHLRNKSHNKEKTSIKKIADLFYNSTGDNNKDIISYSSGEKHRKRNKEKKIDEKNIRSHMIKINGIVVSYNIDRSGKNIDKKKIVFLCNNDECKAKGVYLVDENIFKETERHNFSNCFHVIGHKNKSIRDELIKDKTCDGYQILKNDKFIRDKKVIYLS